MNDNDMNDNDMNDNDMNDNEINENGIEDIDLSAQLAQLWAASEFGQRTAEQAAREQIRAFNFKDQILLYSAQRSDSTVQIALLDPQALASGRQNYARVNVQKPIQ